LKAFPEERVSGENRFWISTYPKLFDSKRSFFLRVTQLGGFYGSAKARCPTELFIPFDIEVPNLAENSTRGEEVFQRSTDPYIGGLRCGSIAQTLSKVCALWNAFRVYNYYLRYY